MNRSIDPRLEVSVIVMTFNRPESLGRCLESLSKQTFPSVMFEVVIVDGSVVPAREVVTKLRDRLAGKNGDKQADRSHHSQHQGSPAESPLRNAA